jgi:hypothetical protein
MAEQGGVELGDLKLFVMALRDVFGKTEGKF